jgi:hypothetical protein
MEPVINWGELQKPILDKLLLPGQSAILKKIPRKRAVSLSQIFERSLSCRTDIMTLGLEEG